MIRTSAARSVLFALSAAVVLSGCERPPVDSAQRGFRGTGMAEIDNPRILGTQVALNTAPAPLPAIPAEDTKAGQVYKNVKVLGDLGVGEFNRQMAAISTWVAPKEQCEYCHDLQNLADDSKYTKVVARRMLEMTRRINADWKSHVADTGVTCYTCHRGNHVPDGSWFASAPARSRGVAAATAGQNTVSKLSGTTAMLVDPLSPYLVQANDIRVIGERALPSGHVQSIQNTEGTYGLMMYMSEALGVNCTYCHNSRAFADWSQSSPQRVTAWHGIRMVRDLNVAYIDPLASVFPAQRRGPTGDAAKVACGTCHQGAYKPLYGAQMAKDYPALTARTGN